MNTARRPFARRLAGCLARAGRRRLPARPSAPRGFTLVEMMVVVAILAIIAAIALPNFRSITLNSRISAAISEITNTMNFARSEAIRRRGNVVVAGKPLSICRGHNNAQDWSCGYIVFFDENRNNVRDFGETILKESDEATGLNVMHIAGSAPRVVYIATGINTATPGRFVISPQSGGVSDGRIKTLCHSSGGRMRVVNGDATCNNN